MEEGGDGIEQVERGGLKRRGRKREKEGREGNWGSREGNRLQEAVTHWYPDALGDGGFWGWVAVAGLISYQNLKGNP
jgi:hypothetical protein